MRQLMMAVGFLASALVAGAYTVPDIVSGTAATNVLMWLDASDAATITADETGGVTKWTSKSTAYVNYAYAYTIANADPAYGTIGTTNGVTAYLMGATGSNIDLAFYRALTTIREVFWVVDIQQKEGAFLLGGTSTYNFHRGPAGQYVRSDGAVPLYYATIWNSGVQVASPTTTVIPSGLQLICAQMAGNASADRLSGDRGISGRNGGRALSELIIFDRTLTDAERNAVTAYLQAKWLNNAAHREYLVASLLSGADLLMRLDASDAATVLTNGTGGVTNWLDKSTNGRNAAAYAAYPGDATVYYGTVGPTNGVLAFRTGTAPDSRIDLNYTRMTTIREVFQVMDWQQTFSGTARSFFLGDSSNYSFHRGENNAYFRSDFASAVTGLYIDGADLTSSRFSGVPPAGTHVYDVATSGNLCSDQLTRDRTDQPTRIGGKAVSELLVFGRVLSADERAALAAYLGAKWSGSYVWKGGNGRWSDTDGWLGTVATGGVWVAGGTAIFSNATGTVTLDGDVSAARINVLGSTDVTIAGTGTLTLTGALFVTNAAAITVSAPFAAITKTGAGTLRLQSLPAGGVTMSEGTIDVSGLVSMPVFTSIARGTTVSGAIGSSKPIAISAVTGSSGAIGLTVSLTPAEIQAGDAVTIGTVPAGTAGTAFAVTFTNAETGDAVTGTVAVNGTSLMAVLTQNLTYTPSATGTFFWDKTIGVFDGGKTFADHDNVKFVAATDVVTTVNVTNATAAGDVVVQNGYTFAGDGAISADTLVTVGDVAISNDITAGSVAVSNGTFAAAGTVTADAIVLDDGGSFVMNPAADMSRTVSGPVSGAGLVSKTGEGTTVLAGSNTLVGAYGVDAGTLKMGNGACFGSSGASAGASTVTIGAGATLDCNGQGGFVNNFILSGGTLANTGAETARIGADTRQMATLTLKADSTIVSDRNFGLVNAGSGATTLALDGHTLTKTGNESFWLVNATATTGTLVIANGTVMLMNGSYANILPGTVVVSNGAALSASSATGTIGTLVGDGSVTGGSAITVTNRIAGTLAVTAPLTLASGVTIDLTAIAAAWNLSNSTFTAAGACAVDVTGRTFADGDRLIAWKTMPAGSFSAIGLMDGLSLVKTGSGLVAVSSVKVGDHVWTSGSGDWTSSSFNNITDNYADGSAVAFADSSAGAVTVGLVSGETRDVSAFVASNTAATAYTLAGGAIAAPSLVKTGPGALAIGSALALGGGALSVSDGAAVSLTDVSGSVSGITLNGALASGSLVLGLGSKAFANNGTTTIGSGQTLRIGSSATRTFAGAVADDSALVLDATAGELTLSGVLTGAGRIEKNGSGTVSLSSDSRTFAGTLAVNEGVFGCKVFIGLRTLARLDIASGATCIFGTDTIGGTVITNAGTLQAGGCLPIVNIMLKGGTCYAQANGAAPWRGICWNGTCVVTGGTTSHWTSASSGLVHQLSKADITVDGNSVLSVEAPLVNGPGDRGDTYSLVKSGTGRMVVSAAQSYTGATTVKAGVYTMNAAATGGGAYTIAAGATLDGSGSITSGAATVVGTINGTLTMKGALAFAPDATIDLSDIAAPWNLSNATLTVSAGTNVTIDVTGRTLAAGECLIAWKSMPAGSFTLKGSGRKAEKRADGLYASMIMFYFRVVDAGAGVNVSNDWISARLGVVVGDDNATTVAAALSATHANGATGWQSYVLGLDPTNPASRVVCDAAQDANAGAVTLNALNVASSVPADCGATVSYVLESSANGSAWVDYAVVGATPRADITLSAGGPCFFRFRADISLP